MQYRSVGRTAVQVSTPVLGTMTVDGLGRTAQERNDTSPAPSDPSPRRR